MPKLYFILKDEYKNINIEESVSNIINDFL